jgi:hypothetical protein
LTAAINTIVANQQSLYQHIALLLQQIAVLSFQAQPTTQAHHQCFKPHPSINLPSQVLLRTEDINKGGSNRGINNGKAEDEAPVITKTGATTTGVVMATPHLLITWPCKVVDMVVASVPFPKQLEVLQSAPSSPIR